MFEVKIARVFFISSKKKVFETFSGAAAVKLILLNRNMRNFGLNYFSVIINVEYLLIKQT